MNNYSQGLITAFINIRGQTGLPLSKQLQIDQFIKDTFSECNTIISYFSLVVNNSQNRYGTSSLVKNEFGVENIVMDKEGRIIIFDVGDLTFGNMYIHSGTDSLIRGRRENYFSETVPQLLINHKDSGFIGGDLNCIIEKEDATNNPESKISPSLKRLIKTFKWSDSFRSLHPHSKVFSRYYSTERGEGASRIDRGYHWGDLNVVQSKYIGLAFSDHLAFVTSLSLLIR